MSQCNLLYKVKTLCKYHGEKTVNCDHMIAPKCQQRCHNFKVHLSSQNPKLSPTIS